MKPLSLNGQQFFLFPWSDWIFWWMIDATVGPLRLASGCLTLSAVVEADFGSLVFAGVQGRGERRGARRALGRPSSMAFLFENMVNFCSISCQDMMQWHMRQRDPGESWEGGIWEASLWWLSCGSLAALETGQVHCRAAGSNSPWEARCAKTSICNSSHAVFSWTFQALELWGSGYVKIDTCIEHYWTLLNIIEHGHRNPWSLW